ncbi:MAG: hypothetical protein OET44_21580 [Gammaproteobacteria bacterium]|nr:hypothetical protein [Gammaproteobacteria bacterium]
MRRNGIHGKRQPRNATIIPTLKYADGASAFDRLQKTPQAAGGVVTQSPYIIVNDVDMHCRRALDAGAQIVVPPADQDCGGRLNSCRDPEGYLWNFDGYDPWA